MEARTRRLKSTIDVRRYLASLINRVERSELDISIASKLAYIAGILLKAAESSELEKRVEALERMLSNQRIRHIA